jgi:acetyl-CoA carboxylase carboxyltransferase component
MRRLQLLCDDGSLQVIRSAVTGAEGMVAATGRVGGRHVACYGQDVRVGGGSVGAAHAESILRVLRTARRSRVPVIGFVESGGARMQEGLDSLAGYGRIFSAHVALAREVPQITVITGISAGGGCYGPALTDFVIMTSAASMFLTGPAVVREVMGEDVTAAELGSLTVQDRNGVSHFSAVNDFEAALLVRRLLGYLPQHAGAALPGAPPTDPAIPDPAACVPELARRVYDVRDVLAGIADADSLLEVAPRWATNLLTGFARLEGRPVGVVANQPRRLGGALDAAASEKGARFVDFCDAFGLPLVVLVDTPGFLPGTKQERAGVIRHGATLVRAFARASVPRATVVLRKAFGGPTSR